MNKFATLAESLLTGHDNRRVPEQKYAPLYVMALMLSELYEAHAIAYNLIDSVTPYQEFLSHVRQRSEHLFNVWSQYDL